MVQGRPCTGLDHVFFQVTNFFKLLKLLTLFLILVGRGVKCSPLHIHYDEYLPVPSESWWQTVWTCGIEASNSLRCWLSSQTFFPINNFRVTSCIVELSPKFRQRCSLVLYNKINKLLCNEKKNNFTIGSNGTNSFFRTLCQT
jgi:hypothetical protein